MLQSLCTHHRDDEGGGTESQDAAACWLSSSLRLGGLAEDVDRVPDQELDRPSGRPRLRHALARHPAETRLRVVIADVPEVPVAADAVEHLDPPHAVLVRDAEADEDTEERATRLSSELVVSLEGETDDLARPAHEAVHQRSQARATGDGEAGEVGGLFGVGLGQGNSLVRCRKGGLGDGSR